jgi:hypothetical protein
MAFTRRETRRPRSTAFLSRPAASITLGLEVLCRMMAAMSVPVPHVDVAGRLRRDVGAVRRRPVVTPSLSVRR